MYAGMNIRQMLYNFRFKSSWCSKSRKKHLGYKPENVMVFGDELNDLELFDYAGISIAMEVSHEKSKKSRLYNENTKKKMAFLMPQKDWYGREKLHCLVDIEAAEGPIATIKTNHGDTSVKLFLKKAPKQ